MPPIEMTMSPIDDKICIEIPKKYRSYSFAVTLVPVRKDLADRRRMMRRGARKSAFELMHRPILDDGEELDISRDHEDYGREIDL